MALADLSRIDIKRVRDTLLVQGQHPLINTIRAARARRVAGVRRIHHFSSRTPRRHKAEEP